MPYVDRSGPSEDGVMVAGEDARRAYAAMATDIGPIREKLLERVIVGRVSATALATEQCGKTPNGKAVAAVGQQVRDAVDVLAESFGFAAKVNKSRA